ncbi:UNVERIFIED_CONTAM: hypothetical protein FKN15_011020 [Acipenser sinensis]
MKTVPKNSPPCKRKINKLVLTCPTPLTNTRVLLGEEEEENDEEETGNPEGINGPEMVEEEEPEEQGSAYRYHPCADSGGAKMNTRCPQKRVPSAALFFILCRLTVQPPQSYSVGGQRSSGQLTGKPAGARPDYRGRWCAVSRGHPGRPNPPSPQTTLGQLSAAPWELPSTVGCGIVWIRTSNVQAIERILHS